MKNRGTEIENKSKQMNLTIFTICTVYLNILNETYSKDKEL